MEKTKNYFNKLITIKLRNIYFSFVDFLGMTAGDSTLNCHCALLAMNSLQKCEEDKLKTVFCDYFKFMTTPGTHNDTYAESWHRLFF